MPKLSVVVGLFMLIVFTACREVDVVSDGVGGSASATTTTSEASSSVASTSVSASSGSGGAPMVELTVTLAVDTPPGMTIVHDAENIVVLKVNFATTPQKDAPLNGICFKDVGVGPFSDIVAARFYSSTTSYVTAIVDQSSQMICVGGLGLVVSAGTVDYGELIVDFYGSAGAQHRFEIADASGVVLLDGGLVDGTFPVVGNPFMLSGATVGQLTTTIEDPVGPTFIGCSVNWNASAPLINFELVVSPQDDLEVEHAKFTLESTDGGFVRGSNGTPYFSNIRLIGKATFQTTAGPEELNPIFSGSTYAPIEFDDSFLVLNGSTTHYVVLAQLACTEDAPGEFFGHHYRLVKKPFAVGSVMDKVYAEPLPTSHMPPQSDIGGNVFQVVAPSSQAAYCQPWSANDPMMEYGYTGCCGSFTQIMDSALLQTGMLIKGSSHPAVYYYGSDGLRHLFPTTVVLDSWYGPYDANGIPLSNGSICNQVVEIPDVMLSQVQLGTMVTFKPGVYVTGLITDPGRWVVSRGQVARKLSPAVLQDQIYPATAQVRLRRNIPSFFADYQIGAQITNASQYDLAFELSTTIEQDLGLAP